MVGLVNSVNVSDKMEGLNPPPPVTNKSETVFPHVNSFVASVPFASGSPQKKGVNPVYCQSIREINHVKDVSCVDHLSFVKIVTNVPTVVTNLPVGARLQQFWEKWETLGASPKVIRILREGYTLPFRFRPNLTRSPMVISKYVNPQRQSLLLEALTQLTNKNAVEPVTNQTSLGFYNRLFLVPKPNNRWRPILDSGGEAPGLPLQQNNPDCPRVAQHALVLGPGSNVKPDPTLSAQHTQPCVSAIQPGPSQEPVESEPTCLAPRASAIKEQGFSEAVAARIEAPQRRSTRSVYEAKWTIFTKWCLSNQVDFRAPPLKAIADFLLHLFQDKKLQPGTIDGYRSAIADKLGNSTINVSKDENLTRLLDSFHRDRPKGRRGIPSWNLSLVLHQLTKAPFEPLKESSLKHLAFKTVFLLALGSGKRRSEIHAWLHKNIRHQSDWSKVSLYPSPSFLSKNQLAKEGPDSVAPVVIPALAPSLDRSLKGDRSLCPVRALRYYLDRTADLMQNKELVFVSFKKGFDKDISPATISSWIKQTVVLCYELSDQEALTLHQVKAHDVRAFAASKAFQSGISLDQILSACHWKSHNTFTQFYLKDVAWADSELFHLGPVVAAQQVHHQAQK